MNIRNALAKVTVTAVVALSFSSAVFAGTEDLKIFNTLLKVGASPEEFMSQIHIALDDIECSYSNITHKYDCNMSDISADDDQGAPLVLTGKKAREVFQIIAKAGAPSDSGMGRLFFDAKSIRCSQAVEGVMDGSAAERTACQFDFGSDQY
jgi:hypothetical protein